MNQDFWNERYSAESYAYGTEPNRFFREKLDEYNLQGRVLFPAEGEGRNAVWAAQQGIEAVAFDISNEGRNKALQLAGQKGVNIQYEVGDFLQMDLGTFDAIVLIYAHFPQPLRTQLHARFVEALRPGGLIILEAFSINNLPYREKNPSIGGPPVPEMLFSLEDISREFNDLEALELEEKEVELSEGQFHIGTGKVIRYVGRKPIHTEN